MQSRLRTLCIQRLVMTLVITMLPLHAYATHRSAAKVDGPGVRSSSALVLDEQSDEVLYSRQADVASPIASISKLMTALVVLDAHESMDEVLQIALERPIVPIEHAAVAPVAEGFVGGAEKDSSLTN